MCVAIRYIKQKYTDQEQVTVLARRLHDSSIKSDSKYSISLEPT